MAIAKKTGAGVAHLPALRPPDLTRNRYATVITGNCRIIPADDGIDVVEAIVDGVCIPTGSGYGGWTVNSRDGQKAVVEYGGVDPIRYTLPVLLDGWSDDITQQDAFNALLSMAGGFDIDRPTRVYVIGSVPPAVDYRTHQRAWLIESLVPTSEQTLYGPDHNGVSRLMRQAATLTLIEPTGTFLVQEPVKKAQAKKGKKTKGPVYVVARTGDTLLTIAARNGKKWQDLALLNGIRDPANVKRGQRVRVS